MLEAGRLIGVRGPGLWLSAPLGVLAGVLAGALLMVATPVMALAYLAGAGGALVLFAAPHAGLYLMVSTMIAQWPGQFMKLGGVGLAAACLFWALANRRSVIPRDILFYVIGAFAVLVLVSVLTRGAPGASQVAFSYLSYVALYWTFGTLATSSAVPMRLVGVMVGSGLVTAAIGLVQFKFPFVWIATASHSDPSSPYFQGTDWLENLTWGGVLRIESLTGTPDYLGLTMQILIPFTVLWTVRQTTPVRVVAGALATGVLAAALVLSLTRGVMVSMLIITIPFLAHKIGWRRCLPYLVIGAVAAAGFAFAWGPLRERLLATVTEWLSSDAATPGGWRRAMLPVAWSMFLDNFWLGAGVGQHRVIWQNYVSWDAWQGMGAGSLPMHNSYAFIAIELGVFGLLLVLALMFLTWSRLRGLQSYFRRSERPILVDVAHASEVAWAALVFNIFLYPTLDGSFRYIWVLFALVGALSRLMLDERQRDIGGAPRHA